MPVPAGLHGSAAGIAIESKRRRRENQAVDNAAMRKSFCNISVVPLFLTKHSPLAENEKVSALSSNAARLQW
jgi:hypothetical protein